MIRHTVGERVHILVPSWIHHPERKFIGRITYVDGLGRIQINTSDGIFHPDYVDISPAPSHRAEGAVNPLEGLDNPFVIEHTHDWTSHRGGLRLCACGQSLRPVGASS